MNRVQLEGNVGTIIYDNKKEDSGACFIISLATSEKYKDKANNEVVKTTWHKLVSFGVLASRLRPHIIVGTRLMIEGQIQVQRKEIEGKEPQDDVSVIINRFIIAKVLNA